ncbi:unnamed protein product [marine sediment metagenome]|uniref:Uncharacterized protein n=1 Tax=marine sediment metagenome TaxID=412755 RepID=X1LB56_9ZZZZ
MKCPLIKEDCLKEECPWWIKLVIDKKEEGRCAIAWSTILLVEFRIAIEGKANEQKQDILDRLDKLEK